MRWLGDRGTHGLRSANKPASSEQDQATMTFPASPPFPPLPGFPAPGQSPAPFGGQPAQPQYPQQPGYPAPGGFPQAPGFGGQSPMSAFGADFDAADPSQVNRNKLAPGLYVCEVIALREKNGYRGYSVILDFEVKAGAGAGTRAGHVWQPFNNPDPALRAKDMGKLRAAIATLYGYDPNNVELIRQNVTSDVIKQSISSGMFVGKLFVLSVRPYTSKRTQQATVIYDFLPYAQGDEAKASIGQATAAPATAPQQALPAAAAAAFGPAAYVPPPVQGAPVHAPVAFPPPGWTAHPQAPGWYYFTANPQVQKTEADLRAGK